MEISEFYTAAIARYTSTFLLALLCMEDRPQLLRIPYQAGEHRSVARWRHNSRNLFVALVVQNPSVSRLIVLYITRDSEAPDLRSLRFSSIWLDGIKLQLPRTRDGLRRIG